MVRQRLMVTIGAGLLAAATVRPVGAGDAPAMRAHVDPSTGALVKEPPPGEEVTAPAPDRSTEGLVVEPAPGGGNMVRLRGRFVSPLVAHVDPSGAVRVDHDQTGTTR